ncbi:MAG: hypothetical protein ACYTDY_18985, partial [Planctomycetota bacterium]
MRRLALALLLAAAACGEREEPGPVTPPPPRKRIEAFFESFAAAVQQEDLEGFVDHFDPPRLLESVSAWDFVPGPRSDMEEWLHDRVRHGLKVGLMSGQETYRWERIELRRLDFRDGGREAEVLTCQWDEDGFSWKTRWWLTRREDRWRVYDVEDVATGVRVTSFLASMLAEVAGGGPTVSVDDFLVLNAAMVAIGSDDYEGAVEHLDEIADAEFPGPVEALRQLALAGVRLWQEAPEDALHHLERVGALQPDMPLLDLLRATALNCLEEHEEALTLARRYLERVGPDAEGFIQEGAALLGLERTEEAVAAIRSVLELNPDYLDMLVLLCVALPQEEKKEVVERFRELRDPAGSFEYLATELDDFEEAETLRLLALAQKEIAPDDVDADLWLAHALACEERHEEA